MSDSPIAPETQPETIHLSRPWGHMEQYALNTHASVKIVTVNAGAELSLQYHHRRAELWVMLDDGLIVELDGPEGEVHELFDVVERVCRDAGAVSVEIARSEDQRARIWKGRKAAFAAMGRVSPNYYVQDGVVPRTKLPEVLARIRALSERSGLGIGNVFHAGDGNLHPLICYDE